MQLPMKRLYIIDLDHDPARFRARPNSSSMGVVAYVKVKAFTESIGPRCAAREARAYEGARAAYRHQ
jgi:hypothetical protein